MNEINDLEPLFNGVDWLKSDEEIARDLKLHVKTVSMYRLDGSVLGDNPTIPLNVTKYRKIVGHLFLIWPDPMERDEAFVVRKIWGIRLWKEVYWSPQCTKRLVG